MRWTAEAKRDAAIRAPMSRALLREDTRVIERPGWYQLVTPSAPGSMMNEVLLSELAPDTVEAAIDEVVATYAAIDRPAKWCVGPWTRPADMGERLARRGATSWDVRGMVAPTSLAIAPAPGVVVDEVDAAQLDVYAELGVRGWGLPPDQAAADRAMYARAMAASPRRAYCFLARADAEPVGTSALVIVADYAYLIGAQVLAAARGRGVYRALVAARLAFLAARGIELAVTQAREASSAPILERLGFETVFRSRCYVLDGRD